MSSYIYNPLLKKKLQLDTGSVSSSITLTGDVTGTGTGTITTTISSNVVDNSNLTQVSSSTFKGRISAGVGDVENLTSLQATSMLDTFTSLLKGLTPASGGGTVNFLRADGTWATPSGGGGGLTQSEILARVSIRI